MKKNIVILSFCALFLFASVQTPVLEDTTQISPCFIFDDMIEGY